MVSIIIIIISNNSIFTNIASNGIPVIPIAPKDFNQKNEKCEKNDNSSSSSGEDSTQKDKKSDNNHKMHENVEPTMMIGTPIFFGNMPKFCYNKLYKRKQKPFTEREGDWICNSCKNLNFAFRVECNRCKLPKGADPKENNNDDKNKENNQDQNLIKGIKDIINIKKIIIIIIIIKIMGMKVEKNKFSEINK